MQNGPWICLGECWDKWRGRDAIEAGTEVLSTKKKRKKNTQKKNPMMLVIIRTPTTKIIAMITQKLSSS